jgi:hypothetical protein
MTVEEFGAIARRVLAGSAMTLRRVDYGDDADCIFSVRDEYGEVDFVVRSCGILREHEIIKALESHRQHRRRQIAEWNDLHKKAAALSAILKGGSDPTNRLRSMPKLMLKRFMNDFHVQLPALESFVNDPEHVDRGKVLEELQSIPQSWWHKQ